MKYSTDLPQQYSSWNYFYLIFRHIDESVLDLKYNMVFPEIEKTIEKLYHREFVKLKCYDELIQFLRSAEGYLNPVEDNATSILISELSNMTGIKLTQQ